MPTIWTTCPQCHRPIETDYESDGLVIKCPGCDAEVPVPQPLLWRVPNLVWVAAGLLVLLPFTTAPGFVIVFGNWRMIGPAAFLAFLMVMPGYFLVRGHHAAWTIVLVLACVVCFFSLLTLLYGVVSYVMAPTWSDYILLGLLPLMNSTALITMLLIKPVRQWCQH